MQYEEGHISKSMYAIFKILSTPTKGGLLDEFLPKLSLAIWTTTPWTIPANAGMCFIVYAYEVIYTCYIFTCLPALPFFLYFISAVAVNSKLQYAIVEVQYAHLMLLHLLKPKRKFW